jgi:SAM-dependent methyltransferase
MSFSAEWLALREPVDHASVAPDLRAALASRFAGEASIDVVDLGCGAGSNLRGSFDILPDRQSWTLIDHDPALLAAARARLSAWADAAEAEGEGLRLRKGGKSLTVAFRTADLSAGYPDTLFGNAALVTAAALFDIVSEANIAALAESLGRLRRVFYTVLTYDGVAEWQPTHDQDAAVRQAFNAHQATDKGFGPAAGPRATQALADAFAARRYRVSLSPSPWIVRKEHDALRRELDTGFAGAAREMGLDPTLVDGWLAHRLAGAHRVTIVGHQDLLAIPA